MPTKLTELYWILLVAGFSLIIPLFRNWIISIIDKAIDKKLEPVNKQIEQIKISNIEFKDIFLSAISNLEKEILTTRHLIENQLNDMKLILEQNYVKKVDCSEFNQKEK